MALLTGRRLSWWHAEGEPPEPPLQGLVVLLNPPREALYDKINRRVGAMIDDGLVEEVERLLEAGYGPGDPGMTGAGYREIVRYLEGEIPLEEAAEEIRRSHRRYARRQTTWFRHQLPPSTLTLEVLDPGEGEEDRVGEAWITREGRTSA
jgi:tRNA dimethylallyltransferase